MPDAQISNDQLLKQAITTQSRDFFQLMFDATDMFASIWQPYLKCAGRYNLELTGLAVRQAQASMQLGRALTTSLSPADVMDATARYWACVSGHYVQSSERIANAARTTVETVIDNDVVPLPVRAVRKEDGDSGDRRDVIELPQDEPGTRKVA